MHITLERGEFNTIKPIIEDMMKNNSDIKHAVDELIKYGLISTCQIDYHDETSKIITGTETHIDIQKRSAPEILKLILDVINVSITSRSAVEDSVSKMTSHIHDIIDYMDTSASLKPVISNEIPNEIYRDYLYARFNDKLPAPDDDKGMAVGIVSFIQNAMRGGYEEYDGPKYSEDEIEEMSVLVDALTQDLGKKLGRIADYDITKSKDSKTDPDVLTVQFTDGSTIHVDLEKKVVGTGHSSKIVRGTMRFANLFYRCFDHVMH